MNSAQAKTLIRETFTQNFDKPKFHHFIKELLNRFDEEKTFYSHQIANAFKDHVQKFERLGTFTATGGEKVDILVVHLTKESKLEHIRTAMRLGFG